MKKLELTVKTIHFGVVFIEGEALNTIDEHFRQESQTE